MSKIATKKTSPPAKKAKTTKAAQAGRDAKAAPPVDSEPTAAPPVDAKWSGYLRVGSIVPETPNAKTFRLLPASGDGLLPFTFVPGQFLNVAFSIGGARMNRSYSISSSPTHREYIELTVRREPRGAVSRHIVDLLRVGDLVEAGGPVGKFTFTGTEADSIVLISAGVGVTPMMSIARYLTEQSWDGDIFFIFSIHASSDYIFANEIPALERANPKLHITTQAEAEALKPGDSISMVCSMCKNVMVHAVTKDETHVKMMTIGQKHTCADCGGTVTVAGTGKGEGKNEEVKHVCSHCGDDAMFVCATKTGSGAMKDMKHEKK